MSRRPGPAFMVSATWFESDEHAALVDGLKVESANSAVIGHFRLMAAAKLRNSGTFPSEAALRRLLGHYARWLPRYREVGILDDLTIRDWDLWQEDLDTEATRTLAKRRQNDAERKKQKRAAERAAAGPPPDPSPVGEPATPPPANPPSDTFHDQASADNPRTSVGEAKGAEAIEVPPTAEPPLDKDEWAGFGGEWTPFRMAWTARGFRHPPTPPQRAVLWGEEEDRGAIRDYPEGCGRWVAQAPRGARGSDVVGYVLDRYHDRRKAVDEDVVGGRAGPGPSEAAAILASLSQRLAAQAARTGSGGARVESDGLLTHAEEPEEARSLDRANAATIDALGDPAEWHCSHCGHRLVETPSGRRVCTYAPGHPRPGLAVVAAARSVWGDDIADGGAR